MLNEDLGQVERVFTDKTGTLTQNVMQFRVAIVGACAFGSMETEITRRVQAREAELAAAEAADGDNGDAEFDGVGGDGDSASVRTRLAVSRLDSIASLAAPAVSWSQV